MTNHYRRKQKALENHTCIQCGKKRELDSIVLKCKSCTEVYRNYQLVLMEKKKAKKQCISCYAPVEGEHVKCKACISKTGEYAVISRAKRKEEKLCVRCGTPISDDCPECEKCRANVKMQRTKRILQGKCIDCGSPASEYKLLCDPCSVKKNRKARELTRKRIEKGLCPKCGVEVIDFGCSVERQLCLNCAEAKESYRRVRF